MFVRGTNYGSRTWSEGPLLTILGPAKLLAAWTTYGMTAPCYGYSIDTVFDVPCMVPRSHPCYAPYDGNTVS